MKAKPQPPSIGPHKATTWAPAAPVDVDHIVSQLELLNTEAAAPPRRPRQVRLRLRLECETTRYKSKNGRSTFEVMKGQRWIMTVPNREGVIEFAIALDFAIQLMARYGTQTSIDMMNRGWTTLSTLPKPLGLTPIWTCLRCRHRWRRNPKTPRVRPATCPWCHALRWWMPLIHPAKRRKALPPRA